MLKEINKEEIIFLLNKYFPDEFNGNINSPFNKTFAIYENELKGFINYDLIYDRIEINYIYVIEKYRKQGIAIELINCLPNLEITLEVNENNKKAINLYKKMGFNIISKKEKYYGKDSALIMLKEVI